MSIKELESEINSIGESIEKRKQLYPSVQVKEEIISLSVLQMNTEQILSELKLGSDLVMKCNCGYEAAACDFGFGIYIQDCTSCGNHVKIEVSCPECSKIRTIYKDRRYEGD